MAQGTLWSWRAKETETHWRSVWAFLEASSHSSYYLIPAVGICAFFVCVLQYEYDTNETGDRVVLGRGTYGVVYAGRDLSNQVRIAIKEIPERDSRCVKDWTEVGERDVFRLGRQCSTLLLLPVSFSGTHSRCTKRSPCTSTSNTGTSSSIWALFLRTVTSRSSWSKCLGVRRSASTEFRVTEFGFHCGSASSQEAFQHCCGLNGAHWRKPPSSFTPDRSWRGCGTCTRTRLCTGTSKWVSRRRLQNQIWLDQSDWY